MSVWDRPLPFWVFAFQEGIIESENHTVREWFGLEGTSKIIWFQSSCHTQTLFTGPGHSDTLIQARYGVFLESQTL